MDLMTIEAALDTGRDARDDAFTCSVKNKISKLAFLTGVLAASALANNKIPPAPATVAASASRKLAAYADVLARIGAELDDAVLIESARIGVNWSDAIWDAEGSARARISRRIVDELQPSLDRLVEIRTAMILGRPIPPL